MREKVDNQSTVEKIRYKSDNNKRVGKTSLFKKNEPVYVERPPLAVKTKSNNPDKKTYNKWFERIEDPFGIINVQQRTMANGEDGVSHATLISREPHEPSNITSSNIDEVTNAVKVKKAAVYNLAVDGAVAENELCKIDKQ